MLSPEERELHRLKQREAYQTRKAKKNSTNLTDQKQTTTGGTLQLCDEAQLTLDPGAEAISSIHLFKLSIILYYINISEFHFYEY